MLLITPFLYYLDYSRIYGFEKKVDELSAQVDIIPPAVTTVDGDFLPNAEQCLHYDPNSQILELPLKMMITDEFPGKATTGISDIEIWLAKHKPGQHLE